MVLMPLSVLIESAPIRLQVAGVPAPKFAISAATTEANFGFEKDAGTL
jgi:hypothetical protein